MRRAMSFLAVMLAALALTTMTGGGLFPNKTSAGVGMTNVVTPSNLAGWQVQHSHCLGGTSTGSQSFAVGPETPPLGQGSYRFTIGADGDSFETIRNPNFDGVRLDQLTRLQYSTYVTNFNDGQAPYLLLNIDFNGDTTLDDQLFFEPVYQSAAFFPSNPQATVTEGEWQTWDALNGGWWSLNNIAGAGPGVNVKSLAQYLAAQPNARIINAGANGGFRIATGCGGAAWANFDGNVDAVIIGVSGIETTFDFEPFEGGCAPPPANMISWWPAEGNANDIQDGNNGTLQNGAIFGTGFVGQAFSLDGVDDFVSVPDAANLDFPPAGPITVDMWVFRTAANPIIHILGKRVGCGSINYQLALDPTSGLHFTGEPGTGVVTNQDLPLNTWTHLAASFDGTTWKFYINGALVASTTTGGTLGPVNAAPLQIGASGTCGNTFPGLIDEVEIFNRALTDAEVLAIFTAGSLGKCQCEITCPSNITVSNDPNQCGAVVNYPAPTTSGDCGTITCSPASGLFFPVGTTTITCSTTAGPQCQFTVTVVDTQPPSIDCPDNVNAVTTAPGQTSSVVTFPPPAASDNCPGVTTACTPPSGSTFPVGTTTVTCTATDASGNTASCSFTVSVFDVCLQDEARPANVLLFNSFTGQYVFCCGNMSISGRGIVTRLGGNISLQHTAPDRRIMGKISVATRSGNASWQQPGGQVVCTISDFDIRNNTCTCGAVNGGPVG